MPLASTSMSSARMTGLVSPNAQIVSAAQPLSVKQTVSTRPSIPIVPISAPATRVESAPASQASPTRALISVSTAQAPATPTRPGTMASPTLAESVPQPSPSRVTISQPSSVSVTIPQPSPSRVTITPQLTPSRVTVSQPSPSRVVVAQLTPTRMATPQATPPRVIVPQLTPTRVTITPQLTPSRVVVPQLTPTRIPVISASQSPSRVTIPQLSTSSVVAVPQRSGTAQKSPSARSALVDINATMAGIPRVSMPNLKSNVSALPMRASSELMSQKFEVRDYQGLISNSSLEQELLNAGYGPVSKIVVRAPNGDHRTQYIKAINKMGQSVFILIDEQGYSAARTTDLTLIESNSASVVPYSLKTGAYNCAGKDVCGVAFECGSDNICVMSHGSDDLTPKEANFVFVEQATPTAAALESEGSIMSYPVVRLSEIRANPDLVLSNTDAVTRRLRNTAYSAELEELGKLQQSINQLNTNFVEFVNLQNGVAKRLTASLSQLEAYNKGYMANPPATDDAKNRYRLVQFNLTRRNQDIATLLRLVKRVGDARVEIDTIAKEIAEMKDFGDKEFAQIEQVITN